MHPQWLITGAGGQLGCTLLRLLTQADTPVIGFISPAGPAPTFGHTLRCDVTNQTAMTDALRSFPALRTIIHTAAVTAVSVAQQMPDKAYRVNVLATQHLAETAAELGLRLIVLSTDLIFDGAQPPYSESDPPTPCCVYGRSKADMEQAIRDFPDVLVVRPPLMYGLPAVDRPSTFRQQLDAIRAGRELRLFEDEFRTPISLDDAAAACIEAARSDLVGVLHIGGPERLSRLDMGRIAAQALRCSDRHIIPIRQADMVFPEPRPADVSLDSKLFLETFSRPAGRPMQEAMADVVLSLDESSD